MAQSQPRRGSSILLTEFCVIMKNREPVDGNKSGTKESDRKWWIYDTLVFSVVCVQNEQIFDFMKFPMFMTRTERAFDKNVLLVFMVLINGMFWRS